MYYQDLIIEATGCDKETATRLEDIMRHDIFHSTLDWQTKDELVEAAKVALIIDKVLQKLPKHTFLK